MSRASQEVFSLAGEIPLALSRPEERRSYRSAVEQRPSFDTLVPRYSGLAGLRAFAELNVLATHTDARAIEPVACGGIKPVNKEMREEYVQSCGRYR